MNQDIICNVNHTGYEKNCLIDYTTRPFTQEISVETHQNHWQSTELARVVGTFGYNVDVRNYTRKDVAPPNRYDLIIDIHPDAPDIYAGIMRPGCRLIAYLTTSNPSFNNSAEINRLDDLQKRRGFRLAIRRHMEPLDKCVSSYDAFCVIGNNETLRSFQNEFRLPPHYLIKNNGYDLDIPFDKNLKRADSFMFIGGPGQVHKGLDLLLDIFEKRKDVNLFICSNTIAEPDFDLLYHNTLYAGDNIFPLGFIDVHGDLFREAASICSFCIAPSCAEGCAGSVLTGMSAGLIPIVSHVCGFDEDEAIHLRDCSISCIEEMIDQCRLMPVEEIEQKSVYYRNICETRYSRKCYTDSITHALTDILA